MNIDIKPGDTLLGGRFKNIPYVVKSLGVDKNNQPTVITVSGKILKLLTMRVKKLMEKEPLNDTIESSLKEGNKMIKLKSLVKEDNKEKRYVYGTKDNKWHLVGSNDRDYKTGITQDDRQKNYLGDGIEQINNRSKKLT